MIAGKLLEKTDEESLGGRLGYNAATDVFEDLVAVGVIDPVKVHLPFQMFFQALHTAGCCPAACGCFQVPLSDAVCQRLFHCPPCLHLQHSINDSSGGAMSSFSLPPQETHIYLEAKFQECEKLH